MEEFDLGGNVDFEAGAALRFENASGEAFEIADLFWSNGPPSV